MRVRVRRVEGGARGPDPGGDGLRLVPASGPDRDAYGRILRAAELDGDDVGWLLIRAGLGPVEYRDRT